MSCKVYFLGREKSLRKEKATSQEKKRFSNKYKRQITRQRLEKGEWEYV